MKRAYPAYCPSGDGVFSTLEDGVKHYEALGFSSFDKDDGWVTLRRENFEAYIRRCNSLEWQGSVVQLAATLG